MKMSYEAKKSTCANCSKPIQQWKLCVEASYVHLDTGRLTCSPEFQPPQVVAYPID